MLTGIKDLDKLIITYLDSKDILEFCKTCKYANEKVCDESFFRNIIINKYPNTIKYKDYVKLSSYRNYFFTIIYYISKLEKDYYLDYLRKFENLEGSPELEYFAREIGYMFGEYDKDRSLVLASHNGDLPVVKYLTEHGANVNDRNNYALRLASQCGHLSVVKYLTEHGANIQSNDNEALRSASYRAHSEIVKYLIEHGADINIGNDGVLQCFTAKGNLDMVKYLVSKGANIHADDNGIIRISIGKGHLPIVKYLVEQGFNIQDEYDELLKYAIKIKHLDIVNYLQSLQ